MAQEKRQREGENPRLHGESRRTGISHHSAKSNALKQQKEAKNKEGKKNSRNKSQAATSESQWNGPRSHFNQSVHTCSAV